MECTYAPLSGCLGWTKIIHLWKAGRVPGTICGTGCSRDQSLALTELTRESDDISVWNEDECDGGEGKGMLERPWWGRLSQEELASLHCSPEDMWLTLGRTSFIIVGPRAEWKCRACSSQFYNSRGLSYVWVLVCREPCAAAQVTHPRAGPDQPQLPMGRD